MDDVTAIVAETASRIFADHMTHALGIAAGAEVFPTALWRAVEEAGLTRALVPADVGGAGLDPIAAADLIRLAGRHALPLPFGETTVAARLLAEAGLAVPDGPLTFSVSPLKIERVGGERRLRGTAERVPFGRHAVAVVAIAEDTGERFLVRFTAADAVIDRAVDLSGEPRDTLTLDLPLRPEAAAPTRLGTDDLRCMGAALRALAMAGALERVLELTVAHVGERVQFGRPIGRFQAVQQSAAIIASQVAAARGGADFAARALAGPPDPIAVAIAKIRTGEAAGIVAGLAHQLHGAMGFSLEHDLNLFTRRLWAWRGEFGGEAAWSRRLGGEIFDRGAEAFWPFVTAA